VKVMGKKGWVGREDREEKIISVLPNPPLLPSPPTLPTKTALS